MKSAYHKKFVLCFNLLCVVFLLSIVVFSIAHKPKKRQTPPPVEIPRIDSYGPHVYGVDYTMYNLHAKFMLHVTATELYLRPKKLFFFRTNLLKMVVLKNAIISVYKNGEKIIELKKSRLELNPTFKKIVINHPQVVYVKGGFIPDKVCILPKLGKIELFSASNKPKSVVHLF